MVHFMLCLIYYHHNKNFNATFNIKTGGGADKNLYLYLFVKVFGKILRKSREVGYLRGKGGQLRLGSEILQCKPS